MSRRESSMVGVTVKKSHPLTCEHRVRAFVTDDVTSAVVFLLTNHMPPLRS